MKKIKSPKSQPPISVDAPLRSGRVQPSGLQVHDGMLPCGSRANCRFSFQPIRPPSTPSACSVGKALPDLFLEQAKGICAALKSHMAASIRATNRLSLFDSTNALVMVRSSTCTRGATQGLPLSLTAAVPQSMQLGILARLWDGDQPHVMQQALSKYAKGVLLHAQASGYLGPPHLLLAGPAGVVHAMSVDSSINYSLGDRLPYALSSAFTRGNALLQGAWTWSRASTLSKTTSSPSPLSATTVQACRDTTGGARWHASSTPPSALCPPRSTGACWRPRSRCCSSLTSTALTWGAGWSSRGR
jgi:hypothetical protein